MLPHCFADNVKARHMLLVLSIIYSTTLVHHFLSYLLGLAWKRKILSQLSHMEIRYPNDRKSVPCWSMPRLRPLRLAHQTGSGQLLPLTTESAIRAAQGVKRPYHLTARGRKSVPITMTRRVTPSRYFTSLIRRRLLKSFADRHAQTHLSCLGDRS